MAIVEVIDGEIVVDGAVVKTRTDLIKADAETGMPAIDPTTGDFVPKYDRETTRQISNLLLAEMSDEVQGKLATAIHLAGRSVFKALYQHRKTLEDVQKTFNAASTGNGGDVLFEAFRQSQDKKTKLAGSDLISLQVAGEMKANIDWSKQMLDVLLDPDNENSALNSIKVWAINCAME